MRRRSRRPIVRGSFEYQGQKCSAASRLYVPSNLWPEVKEQLVEDVGTIEMGDPADFENFMGAVIDASAVQDALRCDRGGRAAGAEILAGGTTDDSEGYFVEPTVITTEDKGFRLLRDELFGPIVTTYVYDEKRWDDTLSLVDETAPYALTGAVFATERSAIEEAHEALRYSAGNFYVNDKPTGAVVGQQPFGGSRASGTNDKAGSMWNLIRWVTPRTVKETFVPPTDYRYPFLAPGLADGDEGRQGTVGRDRAAWWSAILDGVECRSSTSSGPVDFVPLALAMLAQPSPEDGVHEPGVAQRARRRISGGSGSRGSRSTAPISQASGSTRSSPLEPAMRFASSSRTARSPVARTRRSSRARSS